MADNVVIIVGAGPVGLGSALELARCGVRSIVIEKNEGTSWHPKTRNFNTRTMEIARAWGWETYGRLRNIDTPPGWKSPIRFFDTLLGSEHTTIVSKGFEGPGPDVSPAEPVMSSQELIEEIMMANAKKSGLVDVRFSTEVIELVSGGEDQADHVELRIKDLKAGEVSQLQGKALIAADGAGSFIRRSLGLELEGQRNLRHMVNCYFSSAIEPLIPDRNGVLLFIANERANGVLQPLDANGRWLCQIYVSEEEWTKDVFTKDRAAQWVRDAVGKTDLEVDVHSVGFWKLNATVVERFVQGKILMCGDAAHQFPPTGGLGVNTGLQGMHNVMWKLGMFMKGHASWDLVKTYHEERRPVSKSIVQQSFMNSLNVVRIAAAAAGAEESGLSPDQVAKEANRYGNHLGVEFGAHYTSAAVISDGSIPPEVKDEYSHYTPSPTIGCRAPHIWLGNEQEKLSILDLIGSDFSLLVGPEGSAWVGHADNVSKALGLPIDTHVMGCAGLKDHGQFIASYDVSANGAVLVRPDGHIAWKALSEADAGELEGVVLQLLGRA